MLMARQDDDDMPPNMVYFTSSNLAITPRKQPKTFTVRDVLA